MNNKGQAVITEYVMIFFVAVAALAAMTVYLQRGLEARIHDTRNFMINSVINNKEVCDDNCMLATGNQISPEYEPYYAQTLSDVARNEADTVGSTTGNPTVMGAVHLKTTNETTSTTSASAQLPPCASENPVPSWCNN